MLNIANMAGALLATSDVAARLQVDSSTVRLWCRQGRFPHAQQVGRDWVVPESDLTGFEKPKMGRPKKTAKVLQAEKAAKKKDKTKKQQSS